MKKNVLVDIEATDIVITWVDEFGDMRAALAETEAQALAELESLLSDGTRGVSIRSNLYSHPLAEKIYERYDVVELKND